MFEERKSPADRAGEVRLSGRKPAAPKPKPFDPRAVSASKEVDHREGHWHNAPVKLSQRDLATAHKDPAALKTLFRHKQQGGGHAPDVIVRPATHGRYEVRIPRRFLNLIPYTAIRIVDEDGNLICTGSGPST